MKLTIRPFQHLDIELLASYWFTADEQHLLSMGVDLNKFPKREEFSRMLEKQLALALEERNSYGVTWLLDGKAVGHSNTNPTVFGSHGYMHLHLWKSDNRFNGLGTEFVKLSIPHFFDVLKLNSLYSQPYALNKAPHRTLQNAGFKLEKEFVTVPGAINFEQPVKLWTLNYEDYSKQYK